MVLTDSAVITEGIEAGLIVMVPKGWRGYPDPLDEWLQDASVVISPGRPVRGAELGLVVAARRRRRARRPGLAGAVHRTPRGSGAILHDVADVLIATEETSKRTGRRPQTLDRRAARQAVPESVRRALSADDILTST